MRYAYSLPRAARWPCVALLWLCAAACEKLVPDQSTREATSAAEVARIAIEARPLQTLVLLGPGIDDAALARCAQIRALESVVLVDCDAATSTGLAALAGVRQLRRLGLSDCAQLGDAALAVLPQLSKLVELRLAQGRIDAAAIDAVARCAGLITLRLSGELTPEVDLRRLASLQALRQLDLGAARGVSAALLADLRAALPSCTVIDPR